MKLLTTLLTLLLLASACGSDSGTPSAQDGADPSAPMLAAAVEQLITKDHTFGDGPPPFTEYLIQSSLDPAAGSGEEVAKPEARPLTTEERAAIQAVVEPHGAVQWIDDPDEFRTDDLMPAVEGSAIIGVGEPVINGDGGLVPVSMWCGGLCGTWLTYQLELVDGTWTVTGFDGPIAIS